MTDQSEKITALEQRIAELTEQESELHTLCGLMRAENWALAARVKDLEAQLEAVGAGGVQAMKPSDFSIAQLRHLYANMVNGGVKDSAAAKRIAEGLLAPVIEELERVAPRQEALQADAERYRWLRDYSYGSPPFNKNGDMVWCVSGKGGEDQSPIYGGELEAAIDAARKQGGA